MGDVLCQLGMYTLSVITELSADQFLPHASSLVCLLGNTLNQLQNLACPLSYYTLLTMVHLIPLLEADQKCRRFVTQYFCCILLQLVNMYHQLIPCAMDAVRAFVQADEDKAVEVMELFDDLVENAITVVVPHIKPLVEMSLQFAANKDLGDAIRVKALSFIGWITRTKKKVSSVLAIASVKQLLNFCVYLKNVLVNGLVSLGMLHPSRSKPAIAFKCNRPSRRKFCERLEFGGIVRPIDDKSEEQRVVPANVTSGRREKSVTVGIGAIKSATGMLDYCTVYAVVKHKLVQPIVDVLFQLESIPPANEDMEEYFIDDDDSNTPMTCATQTLDILALHLPPDKLFPPLLQHIEPSLQGNDVYKQKASYLTMAVLAEGCAEYIRSKYLKVFLQYVCTGIRDPTGVVRNAALFALGQFSEHLQPDISQYASELLPVLFDYLNQLCSQLQKNGKEPAGADRMFYALEMFCENLGDELLPYLPTLMERLFTALNPNNSVHLRELALSAIGATASAAKEGMVPYFPRVIEYLKMYVTQEQTEDTMCLQVQAVDTLGVLARTIGADTFMPLAKESIQLGLNLMNSTDDPDLRKSVYGLFGSIATVLKEDMGSFLPVIVQFMLTSLRSSEGIVAHFREEDNGAYQVCEELSDTPEEEDIENESEEEEDEDITGYSVENAYVDEKEEACLALKELAQHSGQQPVNRQPTLGSDKISSAPVLVRPTAATCPRSIWGSSFKGPSSDEVNPERIAIIISVSCYWNISYCENIQVLELVLWLIALSKALMLVIPKCAELIRMDEERSVVMTALDVYCDLLAEVKAPVLEGEGHTDAIINCVMDVMSYKTECQDKDDGESDDPDAEQDEVLIECAGNIVPNLGKAMSPDDFAMYFTNLLPLFTAKTKKVCTMAQRSFSVGTLAESLQALGPRVRQFIPQLLPLFLHMMKDESDEVRNNAIFGIGELVYCGQEALHPYPFYHYRYMYLVSHLNPKPHSQTMSVIAGHGNTTHQYRLLRIEVMAHVIHVAVLPLSLPCFSVSDVENNSIQAGSLMRSGMWSFELVFQEVDCGVTCSVATEDDIWQNG
ncbi:hypothetical protein PR048_033519 [Dryococelus australis]|uniref:Importin subunit beta-1/Transportin-1-like TPR repeats domain-containing protein n=1 Tax=Dryococelus australis TaxID=614101 RepID=A0ABQ9G0I6_9NEOP|nr:hypothetical protein PR048_033519 [Dryococelus australis]